LIEVIKSNISNIIDSKNFYIALFDKNKDVFNVPITINNKNEYYSFAVNKSITSLVIEKKKTIILNEEKIINLISNKKINISEDIPKQWMGVPLFANNEIVGVLGLQSFDNNQAFDVSDAEMLEFVSNQVGGLIQKKKFNDTLKFERAHFKELFDSSPEAIALMDNNYIIININKEFSTLFGYSKEECIGKSIDDLIIMDDQMEESDIFGKAVINGRYIKEDTQRKRKDNSIVDVSVLGAPINVDKNQVAIYAIYRDISERKNTEKKLLLAKEKAEESDKLKTAFLTNMSHEIRTPMNAILGFSELMTDVYLSSNEREEFVLEIRNNSINLLKLIEDIIDISKIESEKIVLKKEELNIDKFLSDLYLKFNDEKGVLGKENISLKLKKQNSSKNAVIFTDSLRLKQIFNHLLNNALKFTDKGSIEFGYSISEKACPNFFVKDTGIGIRRSQQELIFDHFRKIEDDNSRLYRGAGIGLTITKKLVNLLGGEIKVESEPNLGTTFYFTISENISYNNTKIKIKSKNSKQIYDWKDVKILIADDEITNIKVLKAMLARTNANIAVVENGQDAVDYCSKNKVDLVLMDIKMPVLNGIDATKLIKQENPDMKIIIQTAYFYANEKQDCVNAGSCDFIYKPVSPKDLIKTIAKYINT
ncbi:MAG: response regulator, partial [Bacteroidota bacterium]|nr:response regulator [Bacteroidota bacterium]